jgi:hypothetical protein
MEKIYTDTTWSHFENSNGDKVDEIKVDGYYYGDRLLESMPFYISLVDGHIKIRVAKKDQEWFKQFNKDYWFDKIYNDIIRNANDIPGSWDDDYILIGEESNTIKKPEPTHTARHIPRTRIIKIQRFNDI